MKRDELINGLMKGCEHDGSYIPVDEVRRLMRACFTSHPEEQTAEIDDDIREWKETVSQHPSPNIAIKTLANLYDITSDDIKTAIRNYINMKDHPSDIDDAKIQSLAEELYPDSLGKQVTFCENIVWFIEKTK